MKAQCSFLMIGSVRRTFVTVTLDLVYIPEIIRVDLITFTKDSNVEYNLLNSTYTARYVANVRDDLHQEISEKIERSVL